MNTIFRGMPAGLSLKNAVLVNPNDDLQAKYDWLKSSNLDGVMGALSATNQRWLQRTPGDYARNLTADVDYVNVVSISPGSVVDSGTLTNSATHNQIQWGDGVISRQQNRTITVAASDAPQYTKNMADFLCDGTDDDVQINAAIQSILKNNDGSYSGIVKLSAGIFEVGDSINLFRENGGNYCKYGLHGSGMNATQIKLADNTNKDVISCVIPSGSSTAPGFIELKDFVIEGNYNNQVNNVSARLTDNDFTFNNTSPATIDDANSGFTFVADDIIEVSGSSLNDGIYTVASATASTVTLVAGETLVDETSGLTITIRTHNGHGIFFKKNGTGNFYDGNISHVMAFHTCDDAFHLEDTWGYKITDCITEFANGTGLYLTGSQAYVDNLFCAYNTNGGIYQGATDSHFSNIHMYKCAGFAHYLASVQASLFINSSNSTYSNLFIQGFGDDGRVPPTQRSGCAALYVYIGSGNTFSSIMISGIPSGTTPVAYDGKGIFLSSATFNVFSGLSIAYQYADAIDVSGSSYGNSFNGVNAHWGVGGESYDNANGNNIYYGLNMIQLATSATTVIKTEGYVLLNATDGAITATLADGVFDRQRVQMYIAKFTANTATITIAKHETYSPEVVTLDANYDFIILEWDKDSDHWKTVASDVTL